MNQLKIKVLFFLFSLSSLALFAQMDDKEKFLEALYLMDESRFPAAEALLEEVYANDKENANINYCLGLSIFQTFTQKDKERALPFLKLAAQKASPNYSYLDPREKKAPVDVWYYLGKAQHNDYQFLEAIESFKKFKTYVNDKHPLYNEIDKSINMSNYAQQSVLSPVNIKTTNLGQKLNGFYPDFSPVVRIDESAVYYTSRRLRKDSSNYNVYDPIDGMMFEDIYVSQKEEDGTWGEPYSLNINTDGHEATVNLSIDGRTLYLYKDINGNGQLFESKLEDDSMGYETWSEPELLGSDINSKAYETHVTLTPDGKTLYFVSDRDGGFGGKDIYFCNRLPMGSWALSQNAGPILNSNHNEDGVFMHPDGKTMYFSSDGHESMGGYDILFSTITDTGWTVPANMGYPINSVDDDVFFVTTPDGKRAYFSSFKEEGYGEKDVYILDLIDAEESALTLYRGEFTFEDSNVPPSGAEVTITNNTDGELVGSYAPRQRDGQFSAILIPNQSYHFDYKADGYETYEEDIYVSSAGNYQEIYKDIKLRPVRVGGGRTTMTPAPLALADINGGLVKNGIPMLGMRIELLDESGGLVKKTTSNNSGDFQMTELDPSKVYLIRVFSPEGKPQRGYDVAVQNNQGEILPFEQLDDTTYIIVPSVQPFEFYGIGRVKTLAGSVKKDGKPIQGLQVRLENDEQAMIDSEETDQYGQFNFQKLSLDEEYRIVFEGDFPDDPDIIITNDLGQKMRFIKQRKGVYKYVPITELMPRALLSDVLGSVTSLGIPIANLQVLLLRAGQSMINSAATDDVGKFNFEDLDLTKRYFIKFEGDFPEDLKLVMSNDKFDLLLFRKVEDGLYQYDPIFVRLENSKREVLAQEVADNVGELNQKKLKLDEYYQIIFEGNFPEMEVISLTNDKGEEFTFKYMSKGVYEYNPAIDPMPKKLLSDVQGTVTTFGTPIANLQVLLLSADQSRINSAATNDVGKFNFKDLDVTKRYFIKFEGDFPVDLKLVMSNANFDLLLFRKIQEGLYQYDPIFVRLENSKSEVLGKEVADNVGELNQKKLKLDEYYQIVFEGNFPEMEVITLTNDKGEEFDFNYVRKGVYEYVPRGGLVLNSYTIDVRDELDFKETYPRPEELKDVVAYFQKYFTYNMKDISETNKEFVSFIRDIGELVKIRGDAKIIITSSASKVPTRTWKSNSILTRKRAYDTKALLERVFASQGIKPEQYNFVDINTLITGPEYKGDYLTNKSAYEKYQYVRIFIK